MVGMGRDEIGACVGGCVALGVGQWALGRRPGRPGTTGALP